MSMLLDAEPVVVEEELDDTLVHFVCTICYPGTENAIAFCGTDMDGEDDDFEYPDQDSVDCVVCVDIDVCPIDHFKNYIVFGGSSVASSR